MTPETAAPVSPLVKRHIGIFMCPACGGALSVDENDRVSCPACRHAFPCERRIPLLFWPNEWNASKSDVTETVKSFYEINPFPNYDDLDTVFGLIKKAEKGVFARMLNQQIAPDKKVLEMGCGTGQLSNYLGASAERVVFGADLCLNSLRLGEGFRERNDIHNVAFLQMNLFRPCFKPESFDVVICSGVLHHTSDPFFGFKSLSRLVKKGGHIIIGLYNTYGRIPTDVRRQIFKFSGEKLWFLDPRLRDKRLQNTKKRTWFMDQYRHPHESKHTMDEVLRWFDRTGFEFASGIPHPTFLTPFSANDKLFEPNPKGTPVERLGVQLGMLLSGGKEGGFFIMIGRRTA